MGDLVSSQFGTVSCWPIDERRTWPIGAFASPSTSRGGGWLCAACSIWKDSAQLLALEGDESLSGSTKASGDRGNSKPASLEKRVRKDRSGTVGRALRTVYDDMLREEVPRDFLDLLRKLD